MIEQVGVKWVRSGNLLEIYLYRDVQWINRPQLRIRKKNSEKEKEMEISDDDRDRSLAISINHTKKELRRRVHANIDEWAEPNGSKTNATFLTLTIHENITNLDVANNKFMLFIKRLNYFVTGKKESFLKYIAVPEFQKRGAVHYHCIFFNLPYVPKKRIEELWEYGFIKVESVKDRTGSIEYVMKYMRKDLAKMIPKGKKRYLSSRGLKKPTEARGGDHFALDLQENSMWLDSAQIYSDSYMGEWCGKVDFFIYDLSDYEFLKPEILALEERYGVHSNTDKNICDTLSMPASRPKAKSDKSYQLKLR